jgi:hypothetical protein
LSGEMDWMNDASMCIFNIAKCFLTIKCTHLCVKFNI